MKPRAVWAGAMLRHSTQASLYLQRSSGFLFYVKFASKVFTNYLFFSASRFLVFLKVNLILIDISLLVEKMNVTQETTRKFDNFT